MAVHFLNSADAQTEQRNEYPASGFSRSYSFVIKAGTRMSGGQFSACVLRQPTPWIAPKGIAGDSIRQTL
jgi:hypothetical protein